MCFRIICALSLAFATIWLAGVPTSAMAQSIDQPVDLPAVATQNMFRARLVQLGSDWAYLNSAGSAASIQVFSSANGRKQLEQVREVMTRYGVDFRVQSDGFGESIILQRYFRPQFFPAPPGPSLAQFYRSNGLDTAPFAELRRNDALVLSDASCIRFDADTVQRVAAPCNNTAALIWATNIGLGSLKTQLVDEQTLLIIDQSAELTDQCRLSAVDLATGQLRYATGFVANCAFSKLYSGQSQIYAVLSDINSNMLLAFDKTTGASAWATSDRPIRHVMARNAQQVVILRDDSLCALAAADGASQWCVPTTLATLYWQDQNSVVITESIDTESLLKTFDSATGTLLWRKRTRNRIAVIGEEITEQIAPTDANAPLQVMVLNPSTGATIRSVSLDVRLAMPTALHVERLQRSQRTMSDLWLGKLGYDHQTTRLVRDGMLTSTTSDAADWIGSNFRPEPRSYRTRYSGVGRYVVEFFDDDGRTQFELDFNQYTYIGVTEQGDIVSQPSSSDDGVYSLTVHHRDTGAVVATWVGSESPVFDSDRTVPAWSCAGGGVCVLLQSEFSIRALELRTAATLWQRDLPFVGVAISPKQFHQVGASGRVALQTYGSGGDPQLLVLDTQTGDSLQVVPNPLQSHTNRVWPIDTTRVLEWRSNLLVVRDLAQDRVLALHEIEPLTTVVSVDFNAQQLVLGLARLHDRLTAPAITGIAGRGEYFSSVRFLTIPTLVPISEMVIARSPKDDVTPQALIYHSSVEANGQVHLVHGYGNAQGLRNYAYRLMTPRPVDDNLQLKAVTRNTLLLTNTSRSAARVHLAAGALSQVQSCISTAAVCPTQLPAELIIAGGGELRITMAAELSEAYAYPLDWSQETTFQDNSVATFGDWFLADGFE